MISFPISVAKNVTTPFSCSTASIALSIKFPIIVTISAVWMKFGSFDNEEFSSIVNFTFFS